MAEIKKQGCVNTDVSSIEVNQLVGYMPHPTPDPQRYVIRVIQLPGDASAPRYALGRAKGLIVAVSGADQSWVGKETWLFLENIECLLADDWEAWLEKEIPRHAYSSSEVEAAIRKMGRHGFRVVAVEQSRVELEAIYGGSDPARARVEQDN